MAAGAIEPRHVAVPLRAMCPHADVVVGKAVALDQTANRATVETRTGSVDITYDNVVVALGAVARMLPVPGLAEHAHAYDALDRVASGGDFGATGRLDVAVVLDVTLLGLGLGAATLRRRTA